MKDRVQDIGNNCADFLNKFFDALGSKVYSRDLGTLYDRIKTIELSEKPFKSSDVPSNAQGLSSGSGTSRQIDIRPAAWSNSGNYQEFRWNAIANIVVNELLHHARDKSLFSDSALDKAARRLMNPAEQVAADGQMKKRAM